MDNHDRLNKETVYSWNPAIDYDKLINYREYYWMPEGPEHRDRFSRTQCGSRIFRGELGTRCLQLSHTGKMRTIPY